MASAPFAARLSIIRLNARRDLRQDHTEAQFFIDDAVDRVAVFIVRDGQQPVAACSRVTIEGLFHRKPRAEQTNRLVSALLYLQFGGRVGNMKQGNRNAKPQWLVQSCAWYSCIESGNPIRLSRENLPLQPAWLPQHPNRPYAAIVRYHENRRYNEERSLPSATPKRSLLFR